MKSNQHLGCIHGHRMVRHSLLNHWSSITIIYVLLCKYVHYFSVFAYLNSACLNRNFLWVHSFKSYFLVLFLWFHAACQVINKVKILFFLKDRIFWQYSQWILMLGLKRNCKDTKYAVIFSVHPQRLEKQKWPDKRISFAQLKLQMSGLSYRTTWNIIKLESTSIYYLLNIHHTQSNVIWSVKDTVK